MFCWSDWPFWPNTSDQHPFHAGVVLPHLPLPSPLGALTQLSLVFHLHWFSQPRLRSSPHAIATGQTLAVFSYAALHLQGITKSRHKSSLAMLWCQQDLLKLAQSSHHASAAGRQQKPEKDSKGKRKREEFSDSWSCSHGSLCFTAYLCQACRCPEHWTAFLKLCWCTSQENWDVLLLVLSVQHYLKS